MKAVGCDKMALELVYFWTNIDFHTKLQLAVSLTPIIQEGLPLSSELKSASVNISEFPKEDAKRTGTSARPGTRATSSRC